MKREIDVLIGDSAMEDECGENGPVDGGETAKDG